MNRLLICFTCERCIGFKDSDIRSSKLKKLPLLDIDIAICKRFSRTIYVTGLRLVLFPLTPSSL